MVIDHTPSDATSNQLDEELLAAEMPSVATELTDADRAHMCHELEATRW
jgi:hypothetical protein